MLFALYIISHSDILCIIVSLEVCDSYQKGNTKIKIDDKTPISAAVATELLND